MAEDLLRFQLSFPKEAATALLNLSKGNGVSASQVAVKKICDHFNVPYEMRIFKRLVPNENLTQEQIDFQRSREKGYTRSKKAINRRASRSRKQTREMLKILVDIGERDPAVLTHPDSKGRYQLHYDHPKEWDSLSPEERKRKFKCQRARRYRDKYLDEQARMLNDEQNKAFDIEEKSLRLGFQVVGIASDRCCLECRHYSDNRCHKFDVPTEMGGTCLSFEALLGE